MTETEWLASADPAAMLDFLRGSNPLRAECPQPPPSDRKLRLFACACARQVWHLLTDDVPCGWCGGSNRRHIGSGHWDECGLCEKGLVNRSRRAVEVAERYADGLATEEELEAADEVCLGSVVTDQSAATAALAVTVASPQWPVSGVTQAALLRCLFGNPWCPVELPTWKDEGMYALPPEQAEVLGPTVTVQSRYCPWLTPTVRTLARSIYDERRFEDMGVLADALEEAGCTDSDLLGHLRTLCSVCTDQSGFHWGLWRTAALATVNHCTHAVAGRST